MAGLPSKYMKMKGKSLKQKWAAYKKSKKPKGSKASKSKPRSTARKYVRKAANKARKAVSASPMKVFDDITLMLHNGAVLKQIWEMPTIQQKIWLAMLRYTGVRNGDYFPTETSVEGEIGIGEGQTGFDLSAATGLKALGESLLYKKEMSMLAKMSPVKQLIPRTVGQAKNLGVNLLARGGAIEALNEGTKAAVGQKLTALHRRFGERYTGLVYDGDLNYEGWDYMKATGQAMFGGAIVVNKVAAKIMPHIKGGFSIPKI